MGLRMWLEMLVFEEGEDEIDEVRERLLWRSEA